MTSQQLKLMSDVYPSIQARVTYVYTIETTEHLAVLPADIDIPPRRRSS